MYSQPTGYLLTWTTFGTWLHGSKSGSVDRNQNKFGEPFVEPQFELIQKEKVKMKFPPIYFNAKLRIEVKNILLETCEHYGWIIYAGHILPNHIHLVLNVNDEPQIVMKNLKNWCSRKLFDMKLTHRKIKIWTKFGSTIYLWKEFDVKSAINYVLFKQNREY